MSYLANYSNNRQRRPIRNLDALSKRVFTAPELLCHAFVYDQRARRVQLVTFGKVPASQKRNAQRLEIIRPHKAIAHRKKITGISWRSTLNRKWQVAIYSAQRQHRHEVRRLYGGQHLYSVEGLLV